MRGRRAAAIDAPARAETEAALMESQAQNRTTCLLAGKTDCLGKGCARCGWNSREAERRKRLPLWKNDKKLWEKKVGRVEPGV